MTGVWPRRLAGAARGWLQTRSRAITGALGLGAAVALVGAAGSALEPVLGLERNYGLPALYGLRGPLQPPAGVLVVAIDEQSARELGLPDRPRSWPRSLHAELTRHLARAGARVIAFDLTFDTPSTMPDHDTALGAAMAEAGTVLVVESIRVDELPLHDGSGRSRGTAQVEHRVRPLAPIEAGAVGSAPFLLPKDTRVDWYWTFWQDSGDRPVLPVLALQVYAWDDFAAWLPAPRAAGPRWLASEQGAAEQRRARTVLRERSGSVPHPEGRAGQPANVSQAFDALYRDGPGAYLNYYGPPRTVVTASYARVLAAARGAPDPALDSMIRGAAVFVGYSAATAGGQDRLRDDYRTVYSLPSGLDLSGVEIAATAFANLRDGRRLQLTPWGIDLALVGLGGLLLGATCRWLRPGWAVAASALAAAGWLATAQHAFATHAVWAPWAVPLGVQLPMALFGALWLRYRATRREREHIRQTFAKFLPPPVVEQLIRHIGSVTSANRVVYGACMATDMESYTTLAERLDPGALGELMNQYYALLFAPVERHGGTVVDVVGDSMVAIWVNAGSELEARQRACAAALEVCAATWRFGATLAGGPLPPTRVGLHAGMLLVGSIGASSHYEYRAVGDIVNTASRIQGLNKLLGTRLLASVDTVAGLSGIATRPLGSFLLAGKTQPVELAQLCGGEPGPASALASPDAFAQALSDYRNARWDAAARCLEKLTGDCPEDGAVRFYLARCKALRTAPPAPGWSPVIRVDGK